MKRKARFLLAVMVVMLLLSETSFVTQNVLAAQTTSRKATKKNGFYQEAPRKFCYYKNGKKLKKTWKTIKGNKYYFDKNGYACTGACKIGSKLYLFNGKGILCAGKNSRFVKVGANTYYVNKNGQQKTGWFSVGAYIYYADSKGRISKNATVQGIKTDGKGRAKLSSLNLKTEVKLILKATTTRKMSKRQKLRVSYDYLVRNGGFGYSTAYYPNLGRSKWYLETADRMFTLKKGNCYGFACAFAALAKEIGYKPYLMCGRVPGSRDQASDGYTRHCWVMIDGGHYDPEGSFAGWGGCFGSAGFTTSYVLQKKVLFKY